METTNEELVNNEIRKHILKLINTMTIKNHSMEVSAGSSHGDNYMGKIAKVVIKGEDKNGKNTTLNLIVKTAPTNESFREFAQVRSAFNREMYIYSNVFPALTQLQEEKDTLKRFKCFPKYYGSTMKEYNESLIMEDMKELGFSLCDRHQPLDYNHVLLVMREYGKLHALSYALRDQQPELFKELAENTEDKFFENLNISENAENSFKEITGRALRSLDPYKNKDAYDKFKHFQDNMIELLTEVVKSESAGKYAVITHGDCWINNILFTYKDPLNPKLPTDLCLLDWQLARHASPALDLSYFIFTCTDKNLRDQHYEDMIQEYYNSLKSFLIELGSDPEMFPFKMLQEHLKKFSMHGLHMAIFVLHLMTSEGEEIPNLQSAENVDELAETFGFSSKNAEIYKERVRGAILDFVNYGYEL